MAVSQPCPLRVGLSIAVSVSRYYYVVYKIVFFYVRSAMSEWTSRVVVLREDCYSDVIGLYPEQPGHHVHEVRSEPDVVTALFPTMTSDVVDLSLQSMDETVSVPFYGKRGIALCYALGKGPLFTGTKDEEQDDRELLLHRLKDLSIQDWYGNVVLIGLCTHGMYPDQAPDPRIKVTKIAVPGRTGWIIWMSGDKWDEIISKGPPLGVFLTSDMKNKMPLNFKIQPFYKEDGRWRFRTEEMMTFERTHACEQVQLRLNKPIVPSMISIVMEPDVPSLSAIHHVKFYLMFSAREDELIVDPFHHVMDIHFSRTSFLKIMTAEDDDNENPNSSDGGSLMQRKTIVDED